MSEEKMSGSVLLLEDEDLVSKVAGQMLEYIGYDVVCVQRGEQAVDVYRERLQSGNPFTAVIMDLSIPNGMGGEEAVKKVLSFDPDAKVIVSSGYFQDPAMMDYKKYGFCGAIAKPFSLQDLTRLFQKLF